MPIPRMRKERLHALPGLAFRPDWTHGQGFRFTRLAVLFCLCVVCSSLLLVPGRIMAEAESGRSSRYNLGPGDVLEIAVWKDEELSRQVIIRPDGFISYPLVGEVEAAGRTVSELQKEIESKIQKYVPDTPVAVMLSQLRSTKVFVVGKVAKPGMYVMEGPTRVLQALALAGGLGRFADPDSISVLRYSPEKGEQISLPFDYSDVVDGENLSSHILLKPGDTVVIP
mgnify:CR=1 FL=1